MNQRRKSHKTGASPKSSSLVDADNFIASNNPRNAYFDYANRHLDGEAAIKILGHSTASGIMRAGEICLEQAARATDKQEITDYLERAKEMFSRAEELSLQARRRRVGDVTARSHVQSSYLAINGLKFLEGQLPPRKLAEKAYEETVGIGFTLASEFAKRIDDRNTTGLMSGTIGELATLALLERFSFREQVGSHTYFPFLTHPSEDARKRARTGLNSGWDISVFTSDGDSIALDYMLQVKTRRTSKDSSSSIDDRITLVGLDPDLRISADTNMWIGSQILTECFAELRGFDHSEIATDQLDERTDLLLDLIG